MHVTDAQAREGNGEDALHAHICCMLRYAQLFFESPFPPSLVCSVSLALSLALALSSLFFLLQNLMTPAASTFLV